MHKVSFTNKAKKDLSNIWNYTADYWTEKQADKYYNQIISKCNAIGKNPNAGKTYDKVIHSLKAIRINKHIIFYRIISELEIEIERILHERMDLENRIKDD